MVETKDSEKPTLPSKRKPDLSCEENESHHSKTQKLQTLNNNSEISEGKILERDKECLNLDAQANGNDDEDEEEEDDDDDDDDDDVEGNGEAVVDRKGKGILIEEEDDESDDEDGDSSDGGSDGDSELSDDPLAEVDLENILPSRTRRKVIQPGEYIANDLGDEDDDSDSEDEDA